ncbi:MAG: hypothetical protein QM493_09105 [Sulfurovum sp.]
MKLLLSFLFLFFTSYANEVQINKNQKAIKMNFEQVWTIVSSDPYKMLPQYRVSLKTLSTPRENTILKDSFRTLENRADILEPFRKLAHPNGICFRGVWHIDTPNIYSGYFQKDSKALIIARASTAMSNTSTAHGTRAFGFAGKLFATTNTDKKQTTANFFLIDDLGGTDVKHYADTTMTNEPSISFTYEVAKNMLYATKVAYTFGKVDKNSGIRQLYEISELDNNDTKVITPRWMKLEVTQMKRNNAKDFRDELSIAKGEKIVLDISVANRLIQKHKNWQRIGTITLDKSSVSDSCDKRLHFHHPKWRYDLDYWE